MKQHVQAFALSSLIGAIFALGLTISGMTDPVQVLGFLNIGGAFSPDRFSPWLPKLGFVMLGAILVMAYGFYHSKQGSKKPRLHHQFEWPTNSQIDRRLILGAALFGIGWGLAGLCPGPALATFISGGKPIMIFTASMVLAMLVTRFFVKRRNTNTNTQPQHRA